MLSIRLLGKQVLAIVIVLTMTPFVAAQGPTDGIDDALANPIIEELQDQTTETVAAIEPGRDAPDLAVAITPPSVTQSDTATLRIRIGNGGGPADAFWADVFDEDGERLHEEYVESLGRDAHHEFTVDVPLAPGRNAFRVVIDADRAVAERNESNNEDSTWVLRRHAEPLDVPYPVVLETPSGYLKPVQGFENRLAHAKKQLVLPPTAEGGTWLIHQQWLESRLPDVAFEDADLSIRERSGATYLATPATASNQTTVLTLNRFDLARPAETGAYGLGSPATVLLDDRPMRIRLVETPTHPSVRNDNDTLPHARVTLDFQDDDDSGQDVWVNASWLIDHGIRRPTFAHEDGSRIPFEHRGGFFLVHAEHFSMIHAFDSTVQPFELIADYPLSTVAWDPSSSAIEIRPSRTAEGDETMARPFLPAKEFTITSAIEVPLQGDDEVAYPLVLIDEVDWKQGNTEGDASRSVIGFRYVSGDRGVEYPQLQAIRWKSWTSSSPTVVWSWDATENPGTVSNPYEGWTASLRLRLTSTDTYFELLDSGGNMDRSVSVPNEDLPWSRIDALAVAAAGYPTTHGTTPGRILVKDISITVDKGNLLNYGFGDDGITHWVNEGYADQTSSGNDAALRVVAGSGGAMGRSHREPCVAVDEFSAQFRVNLPPAEEEWGGFVFHFYKDMDYASAGGGRLGFEDADETTTQPHRGYGVEFDLFQDPQFDDAAGPTIALLKDEVSNHVATTNAIGLLTEGWHDVNVERFSQDWPDPDQLYVYVDGALVLTAEVEFDRSETCFGFSGAIEDDWDSVSVDDVRISAIPPTNPPTAASSPTPSVGATGIGRLPMLSWTPGSDSDGDDLLYSVVMSQSTPPAASDPTFVNDCLAWQADTSCTISTTLAGGVTYYWQVLTSDTVHIVPGPLWSFTTATNQPPSTPSNPNPADGATDHPDVPKLTWDTTDPDDTELDYLVYLDTVNPPLTLACGSVEYDYFHQEWVFTWSDQQECAVDVDYNTTYYWQVKVRDTQTTVTGPIWSFSTTASTQNHAPRLPTNLWPATSSFDQHTDFEADTSDKDGDDLLHTFWLRIVGDDGVATQWEAICAEVREPRCDPGRLPNGPRNTGRIYEWKLNVTDGDEWTESSVESFGLRGNTQPPAEPRWPSPADEAVGVANRPTLKWTGYDPSGALRHTVVLDTAFPPAPDSAVEGCIEIKASECALPPLLDAQTYYWSVVEFDGQFTIPGPVWSFTVGVNVPPLPPTSPGPTDGATGEKPVVDLRWEAADANGDRLTYDVYVAQGAAGGRFDPVCAGVSEPSCEFVGQYSSTYRWRVVASDGVHTTSSLVWLFTTSTSTSNHAPSRPVPLFPVDLHNLPASVRFIWEPSVDPDGDPVTYTVYYSHLNEPSSDGRSSGGWQAACVSVATNWCGHNYDLADEQQDYNFPDETEPMLADEVARAVQSGKYFKWYVVASDGQASSRSVSEDFARSSNVVSANSGGDPCVRAGFPALPFGGVGVDGVDERGTEEWYVARPNPEEVSKERDPYSDEVRWLHWRDASECMAEKAPATLPDVTYKFFVGRNEEFPRFQDKAPLGVPIVADWDGENGFFGTLVHFAPSPSGVTGGLTGKLSVYREFGLLEDISALEEARLQITIEGVPGAFEIATWNDHTEVMEFQFSANAGADASTYRVTASHRLVPGSWTNVTAIGDDGTHEVKVMDGTSQPSTVTRGTLAMTRARAADDVTAGAVDEWTLDLTLKEVSGWEQTIAGWQSPIVRTVHVTSESTDQNIELEVGAMPEEANVGTAAADFDDDVSCQAIGDSAPPGSRSPCRRTNIEWWDASRPTPWVRVLMSDSAGTSGGSDGPLEFNVYDLAPEAKIFSRKFTGDTSEGTNPEKRTFGQVFVENQVVDGWPRDAQLLDATVAFSLKPQKAGPGENQMPSGDYEFRITDLATTPNEQATFMWDLAGQAEPIRRGKCYATGGDPFTGPASTAAFKIASPAPLREVIFTHNGTPVLEVHKLAGGSLTTDDRQCEPVAGKFRLERGGSLKLVVDPTRFDWTGGQLTVVDVPTGEAHDEYVVDLSVEKPLEFGHPMEATLTITDGLGIPTWLPKILVRHGELEVTATRLKSLTATYPDPDSSGSPPVSATAEFAEDLGGGINLAPFNPKRLLCNPDCDADDDLTVWADLTMTGMRTLSLSFSEVSDNYWLKTELKVAKNPSEPPAFSANVRAFTEAWWGFALDLDLALLDSPAPTPSAFKYHTKLSSSSDVSCGADNVCWDEKPELRSGHSKNHSQLFYAGFATFKLTVKNLAGEDTPGDWVNSVSDGTADERAMDLIAESRDEHGL